MLSELVRQIQKGDHAAEAQFRGALEPQLVRIVRRALCAGSSTTQLDHRILAETHLVFWELHSEPQAREAVIRQVALRLCRSILERLQSRPADRPCRDGATQDETLLAAGTLLVDSLNKVHLD